MLDLYDSQEPPKLQQAQLAKGHRSRALLPSEVDKRCWRAAIGMCHADSRREAAAVRAAKPASAQAHVYCGFVCILVLG